MRETMDEAEAPQIEQAQFGRSRGVPRPQFLQPEYLTRQQAAEAANISVRTLERLAREGDGPPAIRIGVKVLYPAADLHAWLRARITGKAVAA